MAAPVYSNRLILEQGFGSGSPVPVLTCPDGYVTVIVCVNYVWGVNAGQVYATLQQQTTGAKFAACQSGIEGTLDYFNVILEGRWVFAAGEVVTLSGDGLSEFDCFASGYLLTTP